MSSTRQLFFSPPANGKLQMAGTPASVVAIVKFAQKGLELRGFRHPASQN